MLKIFQKSMRACLAAVLVCLLALTTNAQNKTVTGKVTDAKNGSPLVGATVSTKPSGNATATKSDGSFSLSVKPGVTKLVISFTGYGDKEIAIDASGVVNLTMEPNAEQLQDVVVVGYGTRKLKDATGSVSSIGAKSFNKGVISSPENLFQGRVAGVNVTAASGEPGGAVEINIRGVSSIRSGNGPLIVVDGVPLNGNGSIGTSVFPEGSASARNPLANINPNDIENISILKDAASAAIYGSRGANGVILITTKSGKGANQGIIISVNSSTSNIANKYKLATSSQFLSGLQNVLTKDGVSAADIASALATVNKGASTDWQDQIFQTGISNNVNIGWGITSKDGKTSLRLSGSYDNISGIIKNSGLNRATIRSNFVQDQFLGLEKLRLDYNFSFTRLHNDYAGISNNAGYQGSLIGAALSYNPTAPVYNTGFKSGAYYLKEDGSNDYLQSPYFDSKDNNRNPVAILNNFRDFDNSNNLTSNVSLSYKIFDNVVYKVNFGNEVKNVERNGFGSPLTSSKEYNRTVSWLGYNYDNSGINGNGLGVRSFLQLNSSTVEHTLNFDQTFNNSKLNIILGYSFQSTQTNYNYQQFWGLAQADRTSFNQDFSKFLNSTPITGDTNSYQLQSYFGRLIWNLQDKYIFSAVARLDGSSKLSFGNKYQTFPSLSFKWKLLNEDFAKGATKLFDNLDIKASYGLTGNQELPSYSSLTLNHLINYKADRQDYTSSNPSLTWETTTSATFGIEFGILQGRVRGTIDYYTKNTKNLLFPVDFAQPSASNTRWTNLDGNVINKGIEVGLDFQIIKPKSRNSFGWDLTVNFSSLTNNVENFKAPIVTGEVSGQGLSGAYAQIITNGSPLYSWIMPTFNGFDANGYAIYADGAKDKIQGGSIPTYFGGLTNSFSYNRFTATIFFNYSGGNYIYNNTANALFLKGSLKTGHNVTTDIVNSNESGINPGSVSTRFLEKGDFVRLQNVSINYNVPIKSNGIKSLNIALSAQNLLLFTSYTGLDPEINTDKSRNGVPSRGFDYTAYPKSRTFTLGINIGF